MPKVGFVGWRGMVGQVLMKRMEEEGDWDLYPDRVFFSTSKIEKGPFDSVVENSYDFERLMSCDVIVTCQGGDWTKQVYPEMRQDGWQGVFIDASSALRTDPESVIVLDPINRELIDRRLARGCKLFVGGNCTTSLMLMALHGLFKEGLVKWVDSSTYQAASGAGAKHMEELLSQMSFITGKLSFLSNSSGRIVDLESSATSILRDEVFPKDNFGAPLALSLIPWIDVESDLFTGQTKEEWKMDFETRKILGLADEDHSILADSLCVRVGALRCHSQSLRVGLKEGLAINEIERLLVSANEWVELVPNFKEETLRRLTPAYVSGKLKIAVGRVHYSQIGKNVLKLFTVGDQLLWGAAEPIRRILKIVSAF